MTPKSTAAASIPRLLTIAEVSEALGVCTKTVRRLVAAEDLPHVRIRRQIRIADEDVASFIRRNRH